jgi:uncharacterized integral membrane protein
MGRLLRSAAALIVLIAGLAFHVRNHGPITLDFYAMRLTLPVSWAIVGAMTLGVLLGLLAALPGRLRAARQLQRQARELAALRASLPDSTGDAPHGH